MSTEDDRIVHRKIKKPVKLSIEDNNNYKEYTTITTNEEQVTFTLPKPTGDTEIIVTRIEDSPLKFKIEYKYVKGTK